MPSLTFNAYVTGGELHAFSLFEGQRPLFSLNLKSRPSFWIDGPVLKARLQYGEELPLFSAIGAREAEQLLGVITNATRRYNRRKLFSRIGLAAAIAAVIIATVPFGISRVINEYQTAQSVHMGNESSRSPVEVQPSRFQGLPQLRQHTPNNPYFSGQSSPQQAQPVTATTAIAPHLTPQSPAPQKPDRQQQNVAERAKLAANLKKAADRGYFTIPLSTGHSRTLYIFSDPQCPHCQDFEQLFTALSAHYNVEIFPVTYVGGQTSASDIRPILYLPKEKRKAAWDKLFSVDEGMRDLGIKKVDTPAQPQEARDPEKWKIAGEALSINDVAFIQYRFPGTPWVISDDGRHVPQSVMQNPERMKEFMAEKPEQ